MKKTVFALFAVITLMMPAIAAAVVPVVQVPEPSISILVVAGGVGAAAVARFLRRK